MPPVPFGSVFDNSADTFSAPTSWRTWADQISSRPNYNLDAYSQPQWDFHSAGAQSAGDAFHSASSDYQGQWGDPYILGGSKLMQARIDAQVARDHPGYTDYGKAPTSGSSGKSLGGDWSGVDQWNAAIASASSATGVDANVIKAVMREESNGDPNAAGSPGVWGPMQVNSNAWGDGEWMRDPAANIMKGAEILQTYLGENNGNVYEALRHYHGIGSDGNTTDTQYADLVTGFLKQLQDGTDTGTTPDASTGGSFGKNGLTTSSGLTNLFGGTANVQDWGGYDIPSRNGLYGYGDQYGLNGQDHTGIDIVVPYGTKYHAVFSGTVVCAGTGVGAGTDGGGCAAFQDTIGGGAGRVEVQSDDGNTVMIYGHSSKSDFSPGQHVETGQELGASGGMNSDHVHLEVRVRDPSMPSGWRLVDPTPYITGGVATGASSTAANPNHASVGSSWADLMKVVATGGVINGSDQVGGGTFHDWLRGQTTKALAGTTAATGT